MPKLTLGVLSALALLLLGCGGGGIPSLTDGATPQPDAEPPPAVCGDGLTGGAEACDDANDDDDDNCLATCQFACGDGVVNAIEACDTGVVAGEPGACPTACDDGDACTTDTLAGIECDSSCSFGVIAAFVDGDGCCPGGATSLDDGDCAVVCGNGVVERGETCDSAITTPPGDCPTGCDDAQACTVDTLIDGDTCAARCENAPITTPLGGDGCCPSGATIGTDSDCPPGCGDAVVSPPETCDSDIPPGVVGACPTMCNDAGSCTVDTLVSAMTCSAVCSFVPITAPASGDLCCPPGANMTTDADCLPVCGNGAVESGEACDDGNTVSDDGCSSVCAEEILATAFRFTDMDLRDPHTFISAFGCRDVTNTAFLGFSTNGELQSSIQADGDADGLLDLSPVVLFRPLDQAAVSTPMEILFADCTAPMSSTSCTRDPTATTALSNANNLAALCLDLLAGTTSIYTPAIALPSGPCFVSDATTLTIMVGGVPIVLTNAYLAATWSGTPATNLVNGLVRGFISEADADVTLLPADLPLIGGDPLSSLLPGGTGNCSTSRDDRDTGPDGSSGWYFYLNFVASARPFGG